MDSHLEAAFEDRVSGDGGPFGNDPHDEEGGDLEEYGDDDEGAFRGFFGDDDDDEDDRVRPDGPETASGGLIGQGQY
jgi:hypothetical protein